jgi:AraC family transcriptional regulator
MSLAELAAIAQVGSHHFADLFKRSTGLSPYQYIIQQRLAKAQELLKTTDEHYGNRIATTAQRWSK